MIIRIKKIHILVLLLTILIFSAVIGISTQAISVLKTVEDTCTPLPVIMYHQISKESGRTGKFVITSDQLEKDFKFIKEHGYEAITVEQLINHVEKDAFLPSKPIMLTFDDGYETFHSIVLPLLKKYDLKAIVSIIGTTTQLFTDKEDHNTSYSHLNWTQVQELVKSEYTQVQNHTYDLHHNTGNRKGASKKNGESVENYKIMLSNDLLKLQSEMIEHTNYEPIAFTYPFGAYSTCSSEIIKGLGFKVAFGCEEKLNYIDTDNRDWLYNIHRYNRPSGLSSEIYFKKMLS